MEVQRIASLGASEATWSWAPRPHAIQGWVLLYGGGGWSGGLPGGELVVAGEGEGRGRGPRGGGGGGGKSVAEWLARRDKANHPHRRGGVVARQQKETMRRIGGQRVWWWPEAASGATKQKQARAKPRRKERAFAIAGYEERDMLAKFPGPAEAFKFRPPPSHHMLAVHLV